MQSIQVSSLSLVGSSTKLAFRPIISRLSTCFSLISWARILSNSNHNSLFSVLKDLSFNIFLWEIRYLLSWPRNSFLPAGVWMTSLKTSYSELVSFPTFQTFSRISEICSDFFIKVSNSFKKLNLVFTIIKLKFLIIYKKINWIHNGIKSVHSKISTKK